MGPTWGRQDPGGPHVGPINLAIWGVVSFCIIKMACHPDGHYRDYYPCVLSISQVSVTHSKIEKPGSGTTLLWRRNGRGSVSNHQPHDCLFNRLFRRRSKKTSKLRVTGLCAGNSPGTEFPAQMASNAENVSNWCRHHGIRYPQQ